jgi:hypothetical protein
MAQAQFCFHHWGMKPTVLNWRNLVDYQSLDSDASRVSSSLLCGPSGSSN